MNHPVTESPEGAWRFARTSVSWCTCSDSLFCPILHSSSVLFRRSLQSILKPGRYFVKFFIFYVTKLNYFLLFGRWTFIIGYNLSPIYAAEEVVCSCCIFSRTHVHVRKKKRVAYGNYIRPIEQASEAKDEVWRRWLASIRFSGRFIALDSAW